MKTKTYSGVEWDLGIHVKLIKINNEEIFERELNQCLAELEEDEFNLEIIDIKYATTSEGCSALIIYKCLISGKK